MTTTPNYETKVTHTLAGSLTIQLAHAGVTYYGMPARIESTTLDLRSGDTPCVTAALHVKGDGWGTALGHMALDDVEKDPTSDERRTRRVATAYGLDFLMKIAEVVDVDRWEQLPGKTVLALYESKRPLGQVARGVASWDGARALDFSDHAKAWLAAKEDTGAESDG